jgi:hypothetical protein
VATFQPGSGRETLAPLGAAALENRAAGAGRHPRAESVPAFPASNVRLEGAFQERCEKKMGCGQPCRPRASIEKPASRPASQPSRAGRPYGRGGRARGLRQSARAINVAKSANVEIHRRKTAWPQASHHLSTAVETAVERKNLPAQTSFFALRAACFQALRALGGVAMIAASRTLAEGATSRRATPC